MTVAAHARLEGWKVSLLDLSTSNRLLDADADMIDAPTCFALAGVDPARLAAALASGSSFAFETGMDSCFDTGRLRAPLGASELQRRLVAMRRAARDRAADGDLHALWVALGMLHWCDAAGASHAAPLWLVPVELDDASRLVAIDTLAPCFNHTLGEKLRRDFDIVFEPGGELPVVLAAAEGIAVTRPGWRVERGVRVGVFAPARYAMWKDLDGRDDAVLASPLFAPPASLPSVRVPVPHDLLAPFDADASQLRAVAAAGEGASFVLQGAPGTGKSQTIANLIVHAIANGKSVLFASTKTAALHAVSERLGTVGLGDFCLDIATPRPRAQVAQQLARVLERAFRPGSGRGSFAMRGGDDARLAELRGALDAHVTAMHRTGPLSRSLHDVLGRLVELKTTPRAALAEPDATGLDGGTFLRRLVAIELLAETAKAVEPVAAHPWQKSALTTWPRGEGSEAARAEVLAALDEAAAAGAALAAGVCEVAALVPGILARTREQLAALGGLCELAARSPRPGAELLTHLRSARTDEIGEQIALIRARGSGNVEVPRDPLTYLALAHRHRALVTEVEDRFTSRIEELDAHAVWQQLRKWMQSMAPVRYVALRTVRAQVREVAMPLALETDDAMLTALEAVLAERACRKALLAAAEPAKRWFGELHTADVKALDLTAIDAAVKWCTELRRSFDAVAVAGGEPGRSTAWRAVVAQVACSVDAAEATTAFKRLADGVFRWTSALAALAAATGIDAAALGTGDDHLAALREQVETLRHSIDALPAWVAFHAARDGARAAGIGPAVTAIERGDLAAAELAAAWERATLLAWADAELSDHPAIAEFHGAAHHAHVAAFADLDRAMLALVRSQALARLAERVPKPPKVVRGPVEPGDEVGRLLQIARAPVASAIGAASASASEAGANALRELFAELPTLLPRLAPCMLATPAAIATYLDPSLSFDIVVFDEASLLPAADALGALARAKTAVVVGDSRALRPAGDLPSLLDVCVGARIPELRLSWHYRSKHEDLIAFANERYYDDRLQVFPSAAPRDLAAELGISWRKLDGRAHEGSNRTEAEAIVADIAARLRDPQQRTRSIGVVTFTRAQQALIEDLLEEASESDASLELSPGGEPVLVRTVAGMQGHDRDVVLVSFGASAPAELAAVLTARELAVATTCAREQLVLVTSFVPEDIEAPKGTPGRDLADLLAFARAGGGAARPMADTLPASPITAAIARALIDRGWTVHHQVGCGAYKLDLAIVDPNDTDRYVLAIEHDGIAYASATAARDRDRLRPQVLAQLGWRVHRIWSLDWWTDPEREVQRAHAAIVTAVASARHRRAQPTASAFSVPSIAANAAVGTSSPSSPGATSSGATGDGAGMRPRTARASRPLPLTTSPRTGSAPVIRIPPLVAPPMAGTPTDETSHGALAPAGSSVSGGASGAAGAPEPLAFDATTGATPVLDPSAAMMETTPQSSTMSPSSLSDSSASSPSPSQVAPGGAAPRLAAGSAPIRIARGAIQIGPYTVAAIPAGRRAPDDLFAPRYLPELGKVVEQVLAAEAPMTVDLLARRVGGYFGIGRVTQRVTDQVRIVLAGRGKWGDEENVVWRMDQDPAGVPPVRVAGPGPTARREIEEVPLSELAAAARIVVERAPNIAPPDLVRDAARLLGFARITERVTDRIVLGIQLALRRTLITLDDDRVRLPD